jgi:hypothetical protein
MTQELVSDSLPSKFKLPNIKKYAILGHTMIKMNQEALLTLNTTTLQYELKHSHRTQTTIYDLITATLTPYPQNIPHNTIVIVKGTFMAYIVAEHDCTMEDFYGIHPLGMDPTIDQYTWVTLPANPDLCILGLDSILICAMLLRLQSNGSTRYELKDYHRPQLSLWKMHCHCLSRALFMNLILIFLVSFLLVLSHHHLLRMTIRMSTSLSLRFPLSMMRSLTRYHCLSPLSLIMIS